MPKAIAWLAHRLGLAQKAGEDEENDFFWVVLFFVIVYIDDAALLVLCDARILGWGCAHSQFSC